MDLDVWITDYDSRQKRNGTTYPLVFNSVNGRYTNEFMDRNLGALREYIRRPRSRQPAIQRGTDPDKECYTSTDAKIRSLRWGTMSVRGRYELQFLQPPRRNYDKDGSEL